MLQQTLKEVTIPVCVWQTAEKVRQRRSRIAQTLNVRQRARFASSLSAALLDGLIAHPASDSETDTARAPIAAYYATIEVFRILVEPV